VNTLEEWAGAVCGELGLDPASLDVPVILDMARDVAHGVARPAAPLTAYLLGVAVGQGRPLAGSAARISQLAAQWPPADDAVQDRAGQDRAGQDRAGQDRASHDKAAPRD
jgi:Domain of unknown function (DUF6457)